MKETSNWSARQVYISAAICLALGVSLGYLFRGSGSPPAGPSAVHNPPTAAAPQMPSLEQMKEMANKKAEPLLAKLQADPKNTSLLIQTARIYQSTHQFKEAAAYYDKALTIEPANVEVRGAMASCLYYTGDVDGALQQFERSLKDDPNNANSLFNLGLIRWQGKNDAPGAVTLWKQLLKSNPKLDDQKRAQVEKLIADASRNGSAAGLRNNLEEH